MPKVNKLPASTRFFARVERFVCECPRCGSIILAHIQPASGQSRTQMLTERRRRWTRGFVPGAPYNPVTCRLTCPSCRRTWGVGLILWPVPRSGGGRGVLQPPDARLSARQRTEMRQYSEGRFAHLPLAKGGEHNLAVTSECTCPMPDGMDMGCPIHGWAATNARLEDGVEDGEAEDRQGEEHDPDDDGEAQAEEDTDGREEQGEEEDEEDRDEH